MCRLRTSVKRRRGRPLAEQGLCGQEQGSLVGGGGVVVIVQCKSRYSLLARPDGTDRTMLVHFSVMGPSDEWPGAGPNSAVSSQEPARGRKREKKKSERPTPCLFLSPSRIIHRLGLSLSSSMTPFPGQPFCHSAWVFVLRLRRRTTTASNSSR